MIKPLPKNIFGRTCLLPTGIDFDLNSSTFFVYPHKIHLFGRDLEINSLLFQQQDPSVGACASVTLWSIIHSCSKIFDNVITPNVSKITEMASKLWATILKVDGIRGLDQYQMIHVLQSVGLSYDYYYVKNYNKDLFKTILRAYSGLKIPVIIFLDLMTRKKNPNDPALGHVVSLSGITEDPKKVTAFVDITDIAYIGSRIQNVFINDDNGGPFLKCSIEMIEEENEAKKKESRLILKIPRYVERPHVKNGYEDANINAILVPIYNKIRLDFETIYKYSRIFNGFLNLLRFFKPFVEFIKEKYALSKIDFYLIWDIFLTTESDFKKEILNLRCNLTDHVKMNLITSNYPKYLWRCSCFMKKKDIESYPMEFADFLIDATDLVDSSFIFKIIFWKEDLAQIILDFLTIDDPKILNDLNRVFLNDSNKFSIFFNKISDFLRMETKKAEK
ncbi:MAG: hypothetical protein Q6373_022745 [Candidatus Sigynarchaeota archaeon]